MKHDYILYGVLVLAIGTLFMTFGGFPASQGKVTEVSESYETIMTGTTGNGDVSVEITPLGIEGNQLKLEISANTHSVDLSQFNLKEISFLEYNGKSVNPVSAPSLKGHHASGTLVFDVDSSINDFKLTIKGIPKIEERIFEVEKWQI